MEREVDAGVAYAGHGRIDGKSRAAPTTIGAKIASISVSVGPMFRTVACRWPSKRATDDALQLATEGAERARRAGFVASPRGVAGVLIWQGILDVADEIDAAVIVIGSHGSTGAHELAHGSISHQVAERATRPVLVVPPPQRP